MKWFMPHIPDVVGWDGYNFPYGGISILSYYRSCASATTGTSNLRNSHFRSVRSVQDCMITTQNLFQHLIISNIDSDEVLYYVDGDFMSNNIEQGHITLHPKGIPMVLRQELWAQYRY
jgi:homogentisate 1,2-dioxygenase